MPVQPVRRLPRACRAGLFAAALALVSLAAAAASATLPPSVPPDAYPLREVGRGELRWLGFGIYEASLWTPDGRFDGVAAGRPVALSLWYRRAFTVDELIDITRGEWARLALAPADVRERWSAELRRIWRDVRRGDNLTAVVVPGRGAEFYDATRTLGRIDDPAFGPAFLAIWLDDRSAVQDLRARLLGAAR